MAGYFCTTCLQRFDKYELRHQHPKGGMCPATLVKATGTGLPETGLDRGRMGDEEYDRLLELHIAPYDFGGERHNRPPEPSWRDEIRYDFHRCTHRVESIVEIENEHGRWGLAVCVRCGQVKAKECPHVKTDWRLDGKVLICLNCGVDCT